MNDVSTKLLHQMQQLLDIAEQKQLAITARELETLERLNKQELDMLKTLTQLERSEQSPQPVEVIEELAKFQQALREQLHINEQLLNDALKYTQHMLGQLTEQPDTHSYQPRKQNAPTRSLAFDHKA